MYLTSSHLISSNSPQSTLPWSTSPRFSKAIIINSTPPPSIARYQELDVDTVLFFPVFDVQWIFWLVVQFWNRLVLMTGANYCENNNTKKTRHWRGCDGQHEVINNNSFLSRQGLHILRCLWRVNSKRILSRDSSPVVPSKCDKFYHNTQLQHNLTWKMKLKILHDLACTAEELHHYFFKESDSISENKLQRHHNTLTILSIPPQGHWNLVTSSLTPPNSLSCKRAEYCRGALTDRQDQHSKENTNNSKYRITTKKDWVLHSSIHVQHRNYGKINS